MALRFNESVDNVHDVVYYTALEKKVINTPLFQRLHDVNQSSTVYLTFSSNRTKRYEHSLGVMQIASDMFYNASVNGSTNGSSELLRRLLDAEFSKIVDYIRDHKQLEIVHLSEDGLGILDLIRTDIQEGSGNGRNKIEKMMNDYFFTVFKENCLLDLIPRAITEGYHGFLYCCVMQAIRLTGLLHDIGHPPQSHIIEEVLKEISHELTEKEQKSKSFTNRERTFYKIIKSYTSESSEYFKKIDEDMAIQNKNPEMDEFHEMIGIRMTRKIIEWVGQDYLDAMKVASKTGGAKGKKDKNAEICSDKIYLLFVLTVTEFVFAIFRNKNQFFQELHRIVDGTIDADRIDFVQRDSSNSGMIWGNLSYKRIVNTSMLVPTEVKGEDVVRVCFSNKNICDLDEVLTNRYKVFTLINFHHRSTRVAAIYKKIVGNLAREYLKEKASDSVADNKIIRDISGLWRNLEFNYSDKNTTLSLIQWNDVWLNSLLQERLVADYDNHNQRNNATIGLLREIYLNERKHISVIKHEAEVMQINEAIEPEIEDFRDSISNYLPLLSEKIEKVQNTKTEEANELLSQLKSSYHDLLEILNSLYEPFDWSVWRGLIGQTFIDRAMERILKRESNVRSFLIVPVEFSLGADMDAVSIYDNNGDIRSYSEYSKVDERLQWERKLFPSYYVYVRLKNSTQDVKKQIDYFSRLRRKMGIEIGKGIVSETNKRYNVKAGE